MNNRSESIFSRWHADNDKSTATRASVRMQRTKLTASKSTPTLNKLTTPIAKGRDNAVKKPDENAKPLSTPKTTRQVGRTYNSAKIKSTYHITNKGADERDNVQEGTTKTPLSSANRMNKANVQSSSSTRTPSTPKRGVSTHRTPTKHKTTPIKAKHSLLVEFSDDIFVTPLQDRRSEDQTPPSLSVTSSVHIAAMPNRNRKSPVHLNRSHSTSSLTHCGTNSSATTSSGRSKESDLRRSRSEARLNNISNGGTISTSTPSTSDGEASRLTVGVRVRPLHIREHGNAVFVNENEVSVASEMGSVHKFSYDHCFTSTGSNTASQSDVFESMVRPLLETAFQGYNACLFAYGQTGSGKTYSMMGPLVGNSGLSEESGIIPRFCCELLKQTALLSEESSTTSHVNAAEDNCPPPTVTTTVEISYLEVYNEKIHDLLVPGSTALRVREHPLYGPYVVDLSKHVVNSIEDFQKWLDYGNKKRATAATEMNDKSSRSHTLFTVILTQTFLNINKEGNWTHDQTRRSQINLVDLAGSERIAHSMASMDRIREGVSINRSLLTLGKVMSALVERRSFVPYRESVLTWLLKDSLGGNSRTSMLATVSPCSSHLEETLSTLRYASQARSIVNTVRVNEAPQDRIIRELRAEVERLNGEMEKSRIREQSGSEDIECISLEEVDRLKAEVNERKCQLDMINNELTRYQQQMTNLTMKNDQLIEQLHDKEKLVEDGKAQIESLNKELKPLKALLSATQSQLQENLVKADEMKISKTNVEILQTDLIKSQDDFLKMKQNFEEKLIKQHADYEQLLIKKDEEIKRIKSENETLKDYVCTTREELLNMQSLIKDNILLSKDEKGKLDDEFSNKCKQLNVLKLNNESLESDLNSVRDELTRAHSIIKNDYQKLQKEIHDKQKLVEEMSEELEFLKDENNSLKDQVDKVEELKINLKERENQLMLDSKKKIDKEMKAKHEEICRLKEENGVLQKDLSNINEQLACLKDQLKKLQEDHANSQTLIEERVKEVENLKNENESLNFNLTKSYQVLQETQNRIEEEYKKKQIEKDSLIVEKNEEISKLKSKLLSLEENLNKTLDNLDQQNAKLLQKTENKKIEDAKHKQEVIKYKKEIQHMKQDYEILVKKLSTVQDHETQVNVMVTQFKDELSKVVATKDEAMLKLLDENKLLEKDLDEIQNRITQMYEPLKTKCEKLEKEKLDIYKVVDEKIEEINLLKKDNGLLKAQQSSTRDELLKALSLIEQKSHEIELINGEKENLDKEKQNITGNLQSKVKQLEDSLFRVNNELKLKEQSLTCKDKQISDVKVKLDSVTSRMLIIEAENENLKAGITKSEKIRHSLQSEMSLMIGERTFSEYQLEESRCKDKMINDKEEKINFLEEKIEKSRETQDKLLNELNDLKQNLSIALKNEDVLQNEIVSYKHQIDSLQMQLKNAQKFNEELMEEKLTIVKVMEKQCMEQEEFRNHKEIVAQNASLKKELAFTKEKLVKNANKIDKLKKKITDLEDLLKKIVHDRILLHQKEANFKNAVMMKDVEVYGYITDNLYPHHWEHLTRKARDYTEKYKIPYEFERGDDCVIVRHLMLSAKTTLNHFQFNQWLDKIEKNNFWSREMDKDWAWEVDFRDYLSGEYDITFDRDVGNDNKAINIGVTKTKSGFVDPIIWRDAMVRRHVRGIREDVDALIVHFSSPEDSLIYSILSRLKAVADRLEEVTLHKSVKTF